jgi:Ca2+-binding EF-hand superfamily protein
MKLSLAAFALPLGLTAGCRSTSAPSHAEEAWAHLSGRYDTDGDGRIGRAEYPRGEEAFTRLDRDRDGDVDRQDLALPSQPPAELAVPFFVVSYLAPEDADSIGPQDLAQGFERADVDRDGFLVRGEVETEANAPASVQPFDRFGTVLAAIDLDLDQRLSLAELSGYLERRDRDGDGRVHVRERFLPGPEPAIGWIEPQAREPAPDFHLEPAGGGAPVRLSSFAGRTPVALLFGSFT